MISPPQRVSGKVADALVVPQSGPAEVIAAQFNGSPDTGVVPHRLEPVRQGVKNPLASA